jgi:predicted dehydrogenase
MLRLGIIGYGGFGPFLHGAWAAMEGVEVAAVADADPRRDPGGVRFYPRWEDLVADPGLDLVSVATPPATHADIACAALEAGKHVLVEKPRATRREDALRILAARDRAGRVVTVDYMLRFNPVVEAVHAWCRNGSFGRLRRVVVENYAQDETLPPEHWFWDPERSGGILVEHAVHFIDLVNACTPAPPARVDGLAVRRNARQEDRVMATVLYEDGLVASHYHAFSRPGFFERTSLWFVFDLAQVEVEGWIPMAGRVTALVSPETEPALGRLPGFQPYRERDLAEVEDVSRPEGWGDGGQGGGAPRSLSSGGESYPATALVEGVFAVPGTKAQAYAGALRALLADVRAAIGDPRHRMRVTLQDGLASLDVALRAAAEARSARRTDSRTVRP